jgi:phospholipase C
LIFRVPAIILSPYAKAGTVDHQAADHTSILRLIERLHGLAPLSTRDQNASDLLSAFDFSARPLPPIAVGLTAVQTVTVSSHTTNTLLAVYGSIVGAMVVSAVALVAWPRRRRSRRRRLHP